VNTSPNNPAAPNGPAPAADAARALLDRIVAGDAPAFALIHRPETTGDENLEILVGDVSFPETLDALPTGPESPGDDTASGARHEVLAVVPYRQIAERGFDCVDDGAPLVALSVTAQGVLPVSEVLAGVPDVAIELAGARFDSDDAEYAQTVRRVLAEEIGEGVGANFVIKRSFTAEIADYSPRAALSLFARLLARESGAYWTFVVHAGGRTLVGASPERHISLRDGVAVMNPISGTYRYPATGPTLDGVLEFLSDQKEIDELYMVVDEELKMMGRICAEGGRVVGPFLKEMDRLAHTEYLIEGRSDRDPREILRETLFAPTVTGSPLESACRVIARHEPRGRRYYSGVLALIGRDDTGSSTLDTAILIRTADIDASGRMEIAVGATLVRHSNPEAEVAETRAKAAGLLAALSSEPAGARTFAQRPRLAQHPRVRAALERRNTVIADFWLAKGDDAPPVTQVAAPFGRTALIIDAEDTFTAMIDHQLRAMGWEVTVRRFDELYRLSAYDLVVLGPGPGDPREQDHPKIAALRRAARTLLAAERPFFAVCLSHQVLSLELGLELARRDVPNQGTQKLVDLFGAPETVGFYNTFAARAADDKVVCAGAAGGVVAEVSRDPQTGEVHALRGPGFASVQFHPESVLTLDGPRIISGLLADLSAQLEGGYPEAA